MATLFVQDISLAFGDRDILDGVSFSLDHTSRCGLAGANGSGKSTLMKIIAGEMSADVYSATTSRDLRIAYLPQGDIVFGPATLYSETERAWDRFLPLIEEQHALEDALQGEANQAQILRLGEIHEILLEERYHDRRQIIEGVLFGLGFEAGDLERRCETFSGGWQMRIALAKILIEKPQIMLLDEPTNYLDIEARFWLKNYLKVYEGGVMLVSHDQGFLDERVNEVYELFDGHLTRYSGNYSAYLVQRQAQIAALEAASRAQAQLFEKNEQFIERFRYKASKSRQVQSRIKMLDKVDQVKIPPHLRELSFSFPPSPPSGRDVVVIEDLGKRYGAITVYEHFSLWVNRGDRIAVTGRNGWASPPSSGSLPERTGSTAARYASAPRSASATSARRPGPPSTAVPPSSRRRATPPRVRTRAGSATSSAPSSSRAMMCSSTSRCSAAARRAVFALKILLKPVNLLILDEPTNHLDINAKQMLLKALAAYDGTMIFVSHDAYFIEGLATQVLYLNEGKEPLLYTGGYSDLLAALEQKEAVTPPLLGRDTAPPKEGLLSYKEANQRKNRVISLKREEEACLATHDRLGEQVAAVQVEMARSENYSDGERITALIAEKERLEGEMQEAEGRWLSLVDERERLEAEIANA